MKPVDEISAVALSWVNRISTLPPFLFVVAMLAFAFTLVFVAVSESNHARIEKSWKLLREARDQADLVDDMQTLLLNAETGQRGYLLTGNSAYLAPLTEAKRELPILQKRVVMGFISRPDKQREVDSLNALMMEKMFELETTVNLALAGKRDDAIKIVDQGGGKATMDEARKKFSAMTAGLAGDAGELVEVFDL